MNSILEKRKAEILAQLEHEKYRILKELSGVDKETLSKLRAIMDDYYGAKTDLESKAHNVKILGDKALNEFMVALNQNSAKAVREFEDYIHSYAITEYTENEISNAVRNYTESFGVVQTTGDSETDVMSQRAVSDALSFIPDHIDCVNKFNKNAPLIKLGFYYEDEFHSNIDYKVTHPIYVKRGRTYKWKFDYAYLGSKNTIVWVVDKNNNLIRTVNGVADGDYLTYQADFTGFISVNMGISSISDFMVCYEEEYPDSYVPHKAEFNGDIKAINIKGRISKDILDFIKREKSPNIFNKDDIITDHYFAYETGVATADNACFCAYIPIDHAGTYQLMVAGNLFGMWGVCQIPCFDSEKNFKGRLVATTTETVSSAENKATLVITDSDIRNKGISYIGFSGRNVSLNKAMVYEGDSYPDKYVPYYDRYVLDGVGISETLSNTNPLRDKVISFNGDSICEGYVNGGGYAKLIGERNGAIVENIGVSSGTIAYSESKHTAQPNYYHCISRTINEMREDADYIVLEGGVNDLYNTDISLGTISNGYNATLDDTTFCGAFENMLKQALIRFHGKKIGYIAVHKMTPYFDGDKTEENAYHMAIKICKKWGIPVLDLNVSCPPFGYLRDNPNTKFIADTYTASGDGWHPNEIGYLKYYVPQIESWLKSL